MPHKPGCALEGFPWRTQDAERTERGEGGSMEVREKEDQPGPGPRERWGGDGWGWVGLLENLPE